MGAMRIATCIASRRALAACAVLVACVAPARGQDEEDERIGFERTPPRLSLVDGDVSFFRSGAEEWTPARVNTALAAGDELYSDDRANLELQIGVRAFARAGQRTRLGLTSLEPDFLQLRVTAGDVSLDLRSLSSGQSFELDTPHAAFSVERSGYYRVEVDGDTTSFTCRRGGRARVTLASGESMDIAASEQVVVSGTDAPQIESYAAPELDSWDRWNYARTDDQLDAVSARYVPPGVYGAEELDHYGDWRLLPTYGAVWVPRRVAVGWAPYSAGRWMLDPFYGWTWVDDAPWGWAPFHYGRWVHVSGRWGWCPGPLVARPLYAPALVAFYGGGGFSVGVAIGRPQIGWVALGWGEPLIPWWGPAHFRERAHWAGWRGPRVVNRVAVLHRTAHRARELERYENARVRDAIVAVDRDHFGRRSGKGARFTRARAERFSPLHGGLDVRPDRTSLVPDARRAAQPPADLGRRSVVATREPRLDPVPGLEPGGDPKGRGPRGAREADPGPREARPPVRVVRPTHERPEVSKRAPFGRQSERERSLRPLPPRFQSFELERLSRPRLERPHAMPREPAEAPAADPPLPSPRAREQAPPERGAPAFGRGRELSRPRDLPGEPANRVYRGRRSEPQSLHERGSPGGSESPRGDRPRRRGAGGGGREQGMP